ncbi:unnamed protein product [Cyprideis torosa]|uniref:Uncharacterized protein n=1 Tax=Cyprideis torosa TaxID=163714 RepID=A0A7R8W2X8_9CRUS|nr:unnamed protein product [Cyprideis torosa]CAG0882447.1 unnamed protein product [Cyprideis torosa]
MPTGYTFVCTCCGFPIIDAGPRPVPGWIKRDTGWMHLCGWISTPPDIGADAMDLDTFRQLILEQHNKYRLRHSSPPLILDQGINDFAQDWANELAARNQLAHRTENSYGENLYFYWSLNRDSVPPEKAVESWYREIKAYEKYYKTGPPARLIPEVGHFTQVVWAASRRLGVGRAQANNGAWYVVANYDPRGNYLNEFTQNVFPPT